MSQIDEFQQALINLDKGRELNDAGKYAEAVTCLLQAESVFLTHENWQNYTECLNELINGLWRNGQLDAALKKGTQAIKVCKKRLGKYSPISSSALNNVGIVYQLKGDFENALKYYKKGLKVKLKVFGKSHPKTSNSYNNLGLLYWETGDYEKALKNYRKCLKIKSATLGADHLKTADTYNNIGSLYHYKGEYENALKFTNKALQIRLKQLGELHPKTASCYNNLGSVYNSKGDYQRAIELCKKSASIQKRTLGEVHPARANSLINLGSNYFSKGDYDKAIHYHLQCLSIRKQSLGENHPLIADVLNNLGNSTQRKGETEKAIQYHSDSLNIRLNTIGADHPATAKSYNNLANLLLTKGETKTALNYLTKCLKIQLKNYGEVHPTIGFTYINLGTAHRLKGNFKKAIKYHTKSVKVNTKSLGRTHPDTSESFKVLGDTYFENNQVDLALKHYQNAIIALILDFSDAKVLTNPTLMNCLSYSVLLDSLSAKADALYFQYLNLTKHQTELLAAYHTYHLATQVITYLRQSYQAEGSKLILAQKSVKIYEGAITVALALAGAYAKTEKQETIRQAQEELQQLNPQNQLPTTDQALQLAFTYAEQSKAILLLSHLKNTEAKAAANISQELLDKEYDLRVELNYLDKRITELSANSGEQGNEVTELQSQRFDYLQEYELLIQQLETDYPEYYQLKYETDVAKVAVVQAAMPLGDGAGGMKNTKILSYFLGEEKGYIFTISATDYQVHEIENSTAVRELVADFNYYLEDPAERKNYLKAGYELFKILLQKPLGKAGSVDSLVIIPDDILTTLPFEALLTEAVPPNAQFADLPYLLMDYDISYHFSATLWMHSRQQKEKKTNLPDSSFIGFAPVYRYLAEAKEDEAFLTEHYHEGNTLAEVVRGENCLVLKHSETEVNNIAGLFTQSGATAVKILLHAEASEQNFRKTSTAYKYIHVAAHGIVNEQHPELSGILFSPNEDVQDAQEGNSNTPVTNGLLCIADVYSLQLNAELVVLSCCETGIGKLAKGEGMIALNRGFLYAGASKVVYTLFKVPDAASAQLMQLFYEEILKGADYAAALRQAKLALIRSGEARPVKWAGFLLVG